MEPERRGSQATAERADIQAIADSQAIAGIQPLLQELQGLVGTRALVGTLVFAVREHRVTRVSVVCLVIPDSVVILLNKAGTLDTAGNRDIRGSVGCLATAVFAACLDIAGIVGCRGIPAFAGYPGIRAFAGYPATLDFLDTADTLGIAGRQLPRSTLNLLLTRRF